MHTCDLPCNLGSYPLFSGHEQNTMKTLVAVLDFSHHFTQDVSKKLKWLIFSCNVFWLTYSHIISKPNKKTLRISTKMLIIIMKGKARTDCSNNAVQRSTSSSYKNTLENNYQYQ